MNVILLDIRCLTNVHKRQFEYSRWHKLLSIKRNSIFEKTTDLNYRPTTTTSSPAPTVTIDAVHLRNHCNSEGFKPGKSSSSWHLAKSYCPVYYNPTDPNSSHFVGWLYLSVPINDSRVTFSPSICQRLVKSAKKLLLQHWFSDTAQCVPVENRHPPATDGLRQTSQ
jgi:hypothetical protein